MYKHLLHRVYETHTTPTARKSLTSVSEYVLQVKVLT